MKTTIAFFLLFWINFIHAQFSPADSARGGYGSGRNWWNLTSYDLSVSFDIDKQRIQGSNTIHFSILQVPANGLIQLDLQQPMSLDSVRWLNQTTLELDHKTGNAWFFKVPESFFLSTSANQAVTAYFHGSPRVAKNSPWDGGITWKKDKQNGLPWVSIACQGLGASVWYPNKDSQADEPDSVTMNFTCPDNLICVSNGRFLGKTQQENHTATFHWKVSNPINNYNIIPYIGDYVQLKDTFQGEKGPLTMEFWCLRGNEQKAAKQFPDAKRTLEAFEYWFGPYPFYEDGYKLVEAPYLGMEHQSAVAYGNGFKNGYRGMDLSGTGIGLNWDYIIVHESGHEWFGNNITSKDIADMWIHEAFTCYSETLFTEYWYGKADADKYCSGLRKNIANDQPIIGPYGVNEEGSGDMYYKGANMIHTIRQLIGNDSLFRQMLREMNRKFYHQTVTTTQIESFMSEFSGLDLHLIFDQYLRTKNPPTLEIEYSRKTMRYRWTNCIEGFNMPLLTDQGTLSCSENWQEYNYRKKPPVLNKNQYYKEEVRY